MPKASFDDCYDSNGKFICTHSSSGSDKEPLNEKQKLLNAVSKAREFNNKQKDRKNYSHNLSDFIHQAVDHPFTQKLLLDSEKSYEEKFDNILYSRMSPSSAARLDRARALAGKSKMTANATEVSQDVINKAHAVSAAYTHSTGGIKAAQKYLDDNGVRMTIDPETSHDRAITLVDNDTGKVSIAYRGTQADYRDIGADGLIAAGLDDVNPAVKTANTIFEKAKAKYGEISEILGHSLGGHLATKMGDKHDVKTTTFNAAISAKQILDRKFKHKNNVNGHELWSTTEDVVSILANPLASVDTEKIKHHSLNPLDSTKIGPLEASVSPHGLHQFIEPGTNRTNAAAIKDRKRGHLEAVHSELTATTQAIKSKSYEDFLQRGNHADDSKSRNIYDSARGVDTENHPDMATTSAQRQEFVSTNPIEQEKTFQSLNHGIQTMEHVEPKVRRFTHVAAAFRREIGPRGIAGGALSLLGGAAVAGGGKALGLSDETINKAQYASEALVAGALADTRTVKSKIKTRGAASIKGIGSAIIGDSIQQAVTQFVGDNLAGHMIGGAVGATAGDLLVDAAAGTAVRMAGSTIIGEAMAAAGFGAWGGVFGLAAGFVAGAVIGGVSYAIGAANDEANFHKNFEPMFEGSDISQDNLWKMYKNEMEIPQKAIWRAMINDENAPEAKKAYFRKLLNDETPSLDEYLNYLEATDPDKAQEERNRIEQEQEDGEQQRQEEEQRVEEENNKRLQAQQAAQEAARANSQNGNEFDLNYARDLMRTKLRAKLTRLKQNNQPHGIKVQNKLAVNYINNHLDLKQAILETNPSLITQLESPQPEGEITTA